MTPWKLLGKYIANQASPSERDEVGKWLDQEPDNHQVLKQLLKVYRMDGGELPDFTSFKDADWQLITNRLQSENQNRIVPLFSRFWFRAAAVLAFLFAGSLFWYIKTPTFLPYEAKIIASDSLRKAVLPDSTVVWLNKGSSLEVLRGYDSDDRKVILNGEAFFEVKKNPDAPFIVLTGSISTRVLGTVFNIHAYHPGDSTITVTVKEGKVKVYVTDRPDVGTSLIHDEVALFNHASGLIKQSNRDLNFLSWKTGLIRFEEAPLKAVCIFLSKYYSKDIRLNDSALENYTITTVLDHKTAEQSVQLISITLGLRIEQKGTVTYLTE